MSLDQVEKSDTDWEWSVSEGIFLKAASYTFGLHNSGPSSAELDMYGLMMPNSSESEIISSASFVGRRIICPQNP